MNGNAGTSHYDSRVFFFVFLGLTIFFGCVCVFFTDDMNQSPTVFVRGEKGGWSELFSRKGGKSLFIAFVLAMASQLTGINAIIFYGKTTIKSKQTESLTHMHTFTQTHPYTQTHY